MITTGLNKTEKFPVYFYEWQSWSLFLFKYLYDNVIRIEAKVHQSNESILEQIVTDKGYFLFHVNLTKTEYFLRDKEGLLNALKNKGIIILNADINNTSKRHLQAVMKSLGLNVTRASAEGDPNELLMVKTNFNYGGMLEKNLTRAEFGLLNLSTDIYKAGIKYDIIKRKKIKNKTWRNKNLIVEKYITNTHDHFYRVYKLLNRMVVSEVSDTAIIKKLDIGIPRINHFYDLDTYDPLSNGDSKYNEMVTALISLCAALKIDFGAIDVVKSDDDKYYIIDVNLTPYWGRDDEPELLKYLSEGLVNNYNKTREAKLIQSL